MQLRLNGVILIFEIFLDKLALLFQLKNRFPLCFLLTQIGQYPNDLYISYSILEFKTDFRTVFHFLISMINFSYFSTKIHVVRGDGFNDGSHHMF